MADNIDWENKGLTGKKQTHNTNSILIQQTDASEASQSSIQLEPNYNFDRKQHRSLKSKAASLPQFIGGKKCNPTSKQPDLSKEENYIEFVKSTLINQLWVKCRSKHETSDKVLVPSWSSFQKQTCLKSTKKASVGYLPAITASPTSFMVIQCIMDITIEWINNLNLSYIFLEVEQAIFNKVLQILFAFQEKESTKFDKIIVRMGGCHVILCLLRIIYSRFKDSVIIELLVEAAVGIEGTIRSALRGGDAKLGIRCYKILFEAFLRSKIQFLETSTEESVEFKNWINTLCNNINYENS